MKTGELELRPAVCKVGFTSLAVWLFCLGLPSTTRAQGVPTPTISIISPSSASAGGPSFVLTVTGTNFLMTSLIRWNGSNRSTTFDSATQLRATITASDLLLSGPATVVVFESLANPSTSNSATFIINPVITSLSPSSITRGGPAFTLTVNGHGFLQKGSTPGTIVQWNGNDRATFYVSSGQLQATILATDITDVGTASVSVYNPSSVGFSNSSTFFINNPPPILTSLSPDSVLAGSPAFTLTINGSNFYAGAAARWNDFDRPTTFVSTTKLTVAIPASDVARGLTATITVFNAPPGGGISNALSFSVNNPVPTLSSLNPSSIVAGSGVFTLTVRGTNFFNRSLVQWNGSSRTTHFISNTQLTADIPASDTATGRSASITVFNVGPGGGISNALPFLVGSPVTISSSSPLPNGTVGTAYSQTLLAQGGTIPYTWSLAQGLLPAGLAISPAGVISGIPTATGTSDFTVQVIDTNQSSATKTFVLFIALPPSAFTFTGVSETLPPASQPKMGIALSAPQPSVISGQLGLTFAPNADLPSGDSNIKDDPSIQFSTGGRTTSFTIPAGSANAVFPPNNAPEATFQTGTVAGTINLNIIGLQTGGIDITPSPNPSQTITVSRSAPVITAFTVPRTASGFEAQIIGYSTTRSLTQAAFRFTARSGGNLQTSSVPVDVNSQFANWYNSASSQPFGSQFRLTIPFTVQGDINAIGSVSVTLTNAAGTSAAANANF